MTTIERTVWKFPLDFESGTITSDGMPLTQCSVGADAKVVLVGFDPQGVLCAWVEHTLIGGLGERTPNRLWLGIAGTGHPISDGMEHVGSVVTGMFVWHVYEGQA